MNTDEAVELHVKCIEKRVERHYNYTNVLFSTTSSTVIVTIALDC